MQASPATIAVMAALLAAIPGSAIASPRAPVRIAQASGAPGASQHGASATPPARSAAMQRISNGSCNPADVDAVVEHAADQYRAGLARAALAAIGQAMACRRDPRMIRLAATYACAAQDASVARLFYSMLAPQYRPAVVQRCQQENIALTGPGAGPASPSRVAIVRASGVSCEPVHVDELMYDASDRFIAGDAQAALAIADQVLACKRDVRMLRMATVYACVAHDDSAHLYYSQLPAQYRRAVQQRCEQENIRLSDGPSPAAARVTALALAPAPSPACATTNVSDLMVQAANQFAAGFSRAALVLITKALACKQDARLYRAATLYACVSRDLTSAKRYLAQVPADNRPALVQRCQAEGLDVTAP
jgi:hypothetical protein